MLPVTNGAKETRRQIFVYTLVLVPLTLAPFAVGFSGLPYAYAATLLGAVFLQRVWAVLRDRQDDEGTSLTGMRRRGRPSNTRSTTCSPCSARWPSTASSDERGGEQPARTET